MSLFLALAALMSAIALGLVLPALLRGRPHATGVSRRAANAVIHATELAALDREFEAGSLTADAHMAARDDVLQRVLAEDEADTHTAARSARWRGAAVALTTPLVAGALYLAVGNPAAIMEATAGVAATPSGISVSQLEQHLRNAPRDGRAWIVLARMHMDADRYAEAAGAYEQALASSAKVAADPLVWCELADAVGMAQGGVLRGRPRELIEKALALKGDHPRALEMAGSAAYEAGELAQALQHWTTLLAQLPADSSASRELGAAIARVRVQIARADQSH
ncbi:MAG TPA: c-type cytochrome biogenesis protein CcmI [Burkholderiales bacterium]|nr:c-type cytochrome biogenesis protein CcmI [Burkholderiales bacterium]